jgi:hypothetical protein
MNIDNLKKYGIPILILIVIIGLIAAYPALKGPEPIPTPTPIPVMTLNARGGDEFLGPKNTAMAEFNTSEKFAVTVVDSKNTCNEKGVWENVDLVQAGTLNCRNEIIELIKQGKITGVTVVDEIPISTSPFVLAVKFNKSQDLYTPMLNAGFIVLRDNTPTISAEKMAIIVTAIVENKKFRDIGIDADGYVNAGFPKSTVGVPSADILLSCYFNGCTEMIGKEALMTTTVDGKEVFTLKPEYANVLVTLYERSGRLIDSSVEYCYNWLNQPSDPVRISIFSESCYASWAKKNANKPELIEDRGNVLVYMADNSVKNTFTLIATSDKGKAYLDAVRNNETFYETIASSTGMRGSGSFNVAPTQYSKYIPEYEFFNYIGFPFGEVTSGTRYVLDNYTK